MERLYYFIKNYGEVGLFEGDLMGYVSNSLINILKEIINVPFEYEVFRDTDKSGKCFSYVEFNISKLIKDSKEKTSEWDELFNALR